jgi:hypothetical protein
MPANNWNVVDWMTMEGLRLLTNQLVCSGYANTDYNKEFTRDFAVGETVRVPLPWQPTIRTGLTYTPQAVNRIETTVTIDQVFGIDFEWDDVEKALRVTRPEEALRDQVLKPCIETIRQEIDSRFAKFAYQNANNIVGSLGTNPTTFDASSAAARQRLIELACPAGGERALIIPPAVNRSLKNNVATYLNPTSDISKQYREGSIGRADGFDFYESMSLYDHTAGTWQSAVSVNTDLADGATSMVVSCTSGDTFKQGDVIGFDDIFQTNPMTRRVTNTAAPFTVTVLEDVTATASTATITFYPAIYGPGSNYQNVTALPTASGTLTLFPGTPNPNGKEGKQALAIHRDAMALVGVKLYTPKAVEMASQQRDPESGLSFRFVKAWDPISSKLVHRFDTVLGFGRLRAANCAVRVLCAA